MEGIGRKGRGTNVLEIGATKARNAADKQAFFESGTTAGPDQDGGGSLKRGVGGGAKRGGGGGGGGPPLPRNQLRQS